MDVRTGYIDSDIALSLPAGTVRLDEIGVTPLYAPMLPDDRYRHMTGVIYHISGRINEEAFHISIQGNMSFSIAPKPESLANREGLLPGLRITSIETSKPVEVEDNCVLPELEGTFDIKIEGVLYADQFTVEIKGVTKVEFSELVYEWYKRNR